MPQDSWPRIAVVGAGAVGCYFGGMLARAGAPVTLIGRQHHVDAINRNGLLIESTKFQQHIPVSATTDINAVSSAGFVMFCVKTLDTEIVAKEIEPHLAPNAVVLSMQNGVDNVDRIRSLTKLNPVATVVYVAAAMAGPGHVKHSARGDLAIANARDTKIDIPGIAAMFERGGIPCRISENIEVELWSKLAMNCGYNAISALSQAKYGRVLHTPSTREVLKQAIVETVAVANAAGVPLAEATVVEAGLKLGEVMAEATSSTAQDLARGKRTEIDSLNGYVFRRGEELGVATPVNQALHALVQLLEEHAAPGTGSGRE